MFSPLTLPTSELRAALRYRLHWRLIHGDSPLKRWSIIRGNVCISLRCDLLQGAQNDTPHVECARLASLVDKSLRVQHLSVDERVSQTVQCLLMHNTAS